MSGTVSDWHLQAVRRDLIYSIQSSINVMIKYKPYTYVRDNQFFTIPGTKLWLLVVRENQLDFAHIPYSPRPRALLTH